MPYERIPNVSSFRVKILGPYHPVLLEGTKGLPNSKVLVRMTPPEFEWEEGDNGGMNKYLKYMFKELNKNRANGRVFWNLGLILLGSSVAFRLSCLKRIMPPPRGPPRG